MNIVPRTELDARYPNLSNLCRPSGVRPRSHGILALSIQRRSTTPSPSQVEQCSCRTMQSTVVVIRPFPPQEPQGRTRTAEDESLAGNWKTKLRKPHLAL